MKRGNNGSLPFKLHYEKHGKLIPTELPTVNKLTLLVDGVRLKLRHYWVHRRFN